MPEMLETLSTAADRLAATDTLEGLRDEVARVTRQLGFVSYNLGLNKSRLVEFMASPTLTNWPQERCEAYVRDDWVRRDPLLRRLASSPAPFLWRPGQWDGTIYQEYADRLRDFGFAGGVTVPLSSAPRHHSGVTFVVEDAARLSPEAMQAARILAHLALSRVLALGIRTPSPDAAERLSQLSALQLEILALVALGKTNAEIGTILDKKRRTVDYHLQQILTKLQVSVRAQAAALFTASRTLSP